MYNTIFCSSQFETTKQNDKYLSQTITMLNKLYFPLKKKKKTQKTQCKNQLMIISKTHQYKKYLK